MAKRTAVAEEPELQTDSHPVAELPSPHKAMTPGDVEDLAERLIMSHEAADQILMAVAKGGTLTGAQITLLRSIGIDNAFAIQRHVDRLKVILGFQESAGTKEQREALASEVAAAESARDAELPAIRQELEGTIKRLQAQIDGLEHAVSRPSGKRALMQKACERLRTPHLLPEFIRDRFDVLEGSTISAFSALREAQSTVANRTAVIELLRKVEPFLQSRNEIPHSNEIGRFVSQREMWADVNSRTIDQAKFAALKATTIRELAAAQKIVERDAPERAGRMAEIESTKDYYVPQ